MASSESQSLHSLLNVGQRQDLKGLIASVIQEMRTDITRGFHITTSGPTQKTVPVEKAKELAETSDNHSPAGKDSSSDHIEISIQEFHKLKSAALAFFDEWQSRVQKRVDEVLNTESKSQANKDEDHAKNVAQLPSKDAKAASSLEQTADSALVLIYPPLPTPLAEISHGERITIVNAILLLLLSLESYTAHSRTLLLRLAPSLHVSVSDLSKMEEDTAVGLLTAASEMDASSSTSAAQQANATSRKWKVGLASVAGAALIGITGGLAAPLVAAGVGGLMGGLGLGATAAAGYLGTLAGSGVLVGSLFGAYGGRMTGKMMDEYAKEIEDFAFLPLGEPELPDRDKHPVEYARAKRAAHLDAKEQSEREKKRRRLRVTIGISGWLTQRSEILSPWHVLSAGGESFALRWEPEALLELGQALQHAVTGYAWSYVKAELLKRTALAGLMAATWPLSFLKFSKVLDNPFSIAKARADKAGAILADALINRAQGERPVSLIGYSLGGRVIAACLKTLAEKNAFGLIDSVVLMGVPMPSDTQDWRIMRAVVSGRLVNVFSENDYVLGFLYRTSSIQFGVAGLQAIDGVEGVENVDVSDTVTGHLRYRYMVGQLLERIGWADLDGQAIGEERKELEKIKDEDRKVEEDAKKKDEAQEGST